MDELNFIPVDREIKLDPDKAMVCKFTKDGTIDYVNDYFTEITGYEVHEVVGESYRNFVHKEVPETILNIILDKMSNKENVHFIIKDQAKDGRYYWFITDFEFKFSGDEMVSITSKRRPAPRTAIPEIDKLYKKMIKIEAHAGLDIAQTFFEGFIEEKGMDFNQFTENLIRQIDSPKAVPTPLSHPNSVKKKPAKKKSLIDILFKK